MKCLVCYADRKYFKVLRASGYWLIIVWRPASRDARCVEVLLKGRAQPMRGSGCRVWRIASQCLVVSSFGSKPSLDYSLIDAMCVVSQCKLKLYTRGDRQVAWKICRHIRVAVNSSVNRYTVSWIHIRVWLIKHCFTRVKDTANHKKKRDVYKSN